jgi:uncharacterized protein (TIGR00162 family)
MEPIIVKYIEKPELNEPVLIEGLPGVGNVGKISAEYLKDKLNAKLFVEIYSKYLPPQVLMKGDGTLYLVKNELYYYKNPAGRDLIILVGDYQGMNAEGQYELSYKVLEIVKEFGTKLIFTLGGYGTGNLVEEPRVFGAATDREMVEEIEKYGVYFSPTDPSGGIVGAAGLLLGLGSVVFGMRGVCLMGETSGYFSDPKSAFQILKIVDKYFNLNLDLEEIELRSQEITEITSQIKEEQREEEEKREDLGYIG